MRTRPASHPISGGTHRSASQSITAPSCAKNGGTLFSHTRPAFVGIVQMLERFQVLT
jgi:hypothetical protein